MNRLKAFLNGFVDGLGFGCVWRYLRNAQDKHIRFADELLKKVGKK